MINTPSLNSSPNLVSFLEKDSGAMIKIEQLLPESPEEDVSTTTTQSSSDSSSATSDDEQYGALPTISKGFQGMRSSIKLSSLQDVIPVHPATRRSSWKMLPKPDMEKICRATSLPTSLPTYLDSGDCSSRELDQDQRKRRTVSFEHVQIRSYDQTIGDNPSVSYGPPVQLDWTFQEHDPVAIDDYESDRGAERRPFKDLGMNYYYRMNLLQHIFGHSKEELKAAQKTASRDKFKRGLTKYFLPVLKLEDAAESGIRKTKRIMQGRRHSTV